MLSHPILGVTLMRRYIPLAIILAFFFLPIAQSQSAGLYWGGTENQLLYYSVNKTGECTPPTHLDISPITLDEVFTLTIQLKFLSELPINPDDLNDVPFATGDATFSNGSSANSAVIFGAIYAVPTGNWTKIQELYSLYLTNVTFIEDSNVWGYSYSYNSYRTVRLNPNTPSFTMNMTSTVLLHYSKTDGVLDYYYLQLTFYDGASESGVVEQTMQRFYELPALVIAGLGIGGIVLMAIVGYKIMNYIPKADRMEISESDSTQ